MRKAMRCWLMRVLWLGCSASACAPAATLTGTVELLAGGRPLRAEATREVIVYFRPDTPSAMPPPAVAEMITLRKRFQPRVLAIPVGGQVRFPNHDPILHNVFSTARGNAFDVGLIGAGEGRVVRFETPGYVRVYCNVHHAMVGHLLVLDTPHFTHPQADGSFRLDDVPPDAGEIVFWHDRARPWRRQVDASQANLPINVRLELERRRVPPHMNKFGKPYGRDARSGY